MLNKKIHRLHFHRLSQDRQGAAAVEAALLTPLLVIVALGIIDIGQYINVAQTVSNASRIGARHAARNETRHTDEVVEAVQTFFANSFPALTSSEIATAVDVSVYRADGTAVSGAELTEIESGSAIAVSVTIDFSTVQWMGVVDYWNLSFDPVLSYGRRE